MKSVRSQRRSYENLNATDTAAIKHQFSWIRADRGAKYGRISLSAGTMILQLKQLLQHCQSNHTVERELQTRIITLMIIIMRICQRQNFGRLLGMGWLGQIFFSQVQFRKTVVVIRLQARPYVQALDKIKSIVYKIKRSFVILLFMF